ncbi:hypothetical protein PsorP6_009607 [Peronosclerospora sorghi]|uniref:Uncharacterized protein n=1 Tax=Peronosclerospora sorghi TaxID=230839 RepID=A0ACC0VYL3_9STRA|nr:hypothetical protein PsorP6_009607 [Peronosclerospora sorghi]
MQKIAAHVYLHVNDVRVDITGLTPGAAAIDGPMTKVRRKMTRMQVWLRIPRSLRAGEADTQILVEHSMSIKCLNICAGVVNHDDGDDDEKAVIKRNDSLKDKEDVGRSETSFLSFPCIDLKVRVAPIPRLLDIVKHIAPIPMKNRIDHLDLVFESINRVSVTLKPLLSLLRDLFVPFMDYQALVQSVRALEHDENVRKPISIEDEAFYVENCDQVDSNTLLFAQDKKDRHERLRIGSCHVLE